MKVFISMPMRGVEPEVIRQRQQTALECINIDMNTLADDMNKLVIDLEKGPLWCLGRGLQAMSKAEAAFFLPGWENARGCRIERMAAEYYGVKVYELIEDGGGYRVAGAGQTSFRELGYE